MGIRYTINESVPKPSTTFYAYADTDFANSRDCISMAGYTFLLNNGVITWNSKKQNKVTTSAAEAKYASIAQVTKEATWLQNLFLELGFPQRKPTIIFSDNQSALAIGHNYQYHSRSQQFNTKNHCIHEKIKQKVINVWYCPTSQMTADIMTKPLPREASCWHIANLGMTLA